MSSAADLGRSQAGPVVTAVAASAPDALACIFEPFGGAGAILKSSRDVYLKVNAVDALPYCFTDPVLVESLCRHLYSAGARRVYVMDSATQGNFTRLVFHTSGLARAAKRAGATPLYLDEDRQVPVDIPGLGAKLHIARTIYEKLVEGGAENTYLSVPKLKTHSMSTVTLALKNQIGLLRHADRMPYHNDRLHEVVAGLYRLVRPDFVVVDGAVAVYHGHYPAVAAQDRSLARLDLLLGGADPLAVDVVGASVLGYPLEEVEHLRLAARSGLGVGNLGSIRVLGQLPEPHRYPWELLDEFPANVTVLEGKQRLCQEGCRGNVLAVLQVLHLDHGIRRPYSMVMGRGHDLGEIDALKPPVMVVGECAAGEVGERLKQRLGGKVHFVQGKNDLAGNVRFQTKLGGVNRMKLARANPLVALALLVRARLAGSSARVPPVLYP